MNYESSGGENKLKNETPEEYRETLRKFRMENNRYYTDNNFYRGTLLPLAESEPEDEDAKEILNEIFEYYTARGDNFNLLKYYEKIGDRENSYKVAGQIEQSGALIEKAQTAEQIWKHFKDDSYKEKAIKDYAELAASYETSGDNLMAAIYNDLLFKITKNEECRKKAIDFHKQFSGERKIKGDSWWQAISVREIGKLSKGTENYSEALSAAINQAERQIQRAEAIGDYKNAGLWARDIFKLTATPESRDRAKNIFLRQIEISETKFKANGDSKDLRTIAKSYWEMWKVTGAEEHRMKAYENYKELLARAIKENDEKQKEECYRVLLYITQ